MLEASAKPVNLYCNGMTDAGYDSGAVSGENSRRNSVGFKEYVRNRRYTMMSRPNRVTVPIPTAAETTRKNSSADSQFGDMPSDLDDDVSPRPLYQRRMSVPEKVFLSADYAILRPSNDTDVKFEIVAAFDRHTDPYRHYMQSLTCYDLQPNHGAVVVIDGELKIHKALTALSQCGHQAAVVSNIEAKGGMGILTVTDCLRAIIMASEGVHKVADQTVSEFLKHNSRKHLISADANTSVWDAARLICLNRVHRIPVVHNEDYPFEGKKSQGDLLYILSLRTVFTETVLKLSDSKRSMGPYIKTRTLSERKLGTWHGLVTIGQNALTSEAITLFLDRRISTVPIVDAHGRVKAVLSKSDVMAELVSHPANYLEILDIPAVDIATNGVLPFATTTMTIYDAIALLVSSEKQSLVVVDVEKRPLGVVSYSDVMDYIQNYADVHHKTSLA